MACWGGERKRQSVVIGPPSIDHDPGQGMIAGLLQRARPGVLGLEQRVLAPAARDIRLARRLARV